MSVSLFLLAALLLLVLYVRKSSKPPLPPGPRKLPLIGNWLDVPATFQWKTYARWSKKYNSDIIHLNLLGKSIVVLNSFAATDELLEKRSSIYSDREDFPMVNGLMGWDFNAASMRYGDEWRIHRRLFNQEFNVRASRKYESRELLGTRKLLQRLISHPDMFLTHFRQMMSEVILSSTYGIEALPSDDPYVELADEAMRGLAAGNVPGVWLVDIFPILKYLPSWFPGAGFKRKALEWRGWARGMMDVPFAETKRQMELGTAPPSYTVDYLRALEDSNHAFYEEYHVKATSGIMFAAGTDTIVSSLGTFVLAMLANPEAQKKAQEELDSVLSMQALPTFEDRESLPYVSALVKEVLRWENVTPFAVSHRVTVEDEYRGYRVPAGSVVIGNTWALLHDEKVYPDPHSFKPERWLLNGRLNPAVRDPEAAFGFGRRQCPGKHMATSSIWIVVASMLATFDISKAVDAEGRVVEPTYEYIPGLVTTPVPFQCAIKPRGPQAAALIQASL
ncbi:cytochrome P450 [Roridomyces roridus]|uniref:Cytochrome P450 n=1 Tax=Roridomyces roridus TaxID=1738132 RepID=A0AAD7BMQ7_9AGAR|nr:cytochrome P450 [Roridomyces roridus]